MCRTRAPLALTFVLAVCVAACGGPSDAERAAQLRYEGRPLAEWWQLRRDPDDPTAAEAQSAMRMLGAAAVPFLADKAASHDLGDVIGGSAVLEGLCRSALPAMEAARATHPSAALEAAIRRVKADSASSVRSGRCTAGGDPVRPEPRR